MHLGGPGHGGYSISQQLLSGRTAGPILQGPVVAPSDDWNSYGPQRQLCGLPAAHSLQKLREIPLARCTATLAPETAQPAGAENTPGSRGPPPAQPGSRGFTQQ